MSGIARSRRANLRKGSGPVCLTRDSGLPSFLFAPAAPLAIPKFDRSVPVGSALPRQGVDVIFKGMLEAGVLKPQHWCESSPTTTLNHAIGDMVKKSGLKTNVFHLHIMDNVERKPNPAENRFYDCFTVERDRPEDGKRWNKDTVIGGLLLRQSLHPDLYYVGKELERWEKLCPKFGQTILDVITRNAYSGFGCLTPPEIREMASYEYWQGEDDHTMAEEEAFEEQHDYLKRENPEDLAATEKKNGHAYCKEDIEMFRTTDLLAGGVPEWAFQPRGFGITGRSSVPLKNGKLVDVYAAEKILELLKELDKLKLTNDKNCMCEPSRFSVSCWMRWNKQDSFGRVVDDVHQNEMNAGEAHDIGWCRLFRAHDTADIADAFREFGKALRAGKVLLDLVKLIGHEDS